MQVFADCRSTLADSPSYRRHRPEQTVLYSIIAEHYPPFVQEIECAGGHLPNFIRQEFEDYLKCGLLEHGFLRVKCDGCRHEHLVAFSCKRRGFSLHAGTVCEPHQRSKLERLCRYITRPPGDRVAGATRV